MVGRRPGTLLGLVLLLAVGLQGCGWQPLYARPSADPASGGVGAKLARISIDPVRTGTTSDPLTGSPAAVYDSRTAQLVQNYLKDALNPYGPPSPADYHLAIALRQDIRATISQGNGNTTREELVMRAAYKLTDQKGTVVLDDHASATTSYDVLLEPFSDLTSRRDALDRTAQQLAAAIQTRLAVFAENLP
ncbi:MAG TPA: LPS assembly lipoprotein LptE [Candidatus Cybelea sp.]|nr:LPS assembly lipoprotein LptE [Candidatus Cybelea sp.]